MSKYIAPTTPRVIRDEHQRRIRLQIDISSLPSSWRDFNEMSDQGQRNAAKSLSMVVQLLDHPRSAFIEEVFRDFEWVLLDFWNYTCEGCGLPYSFCKNHI
jgi:hypothetical protein